MQAIERRWGYVADAHDHRDFLYSAHPECTLAPLLPPLIDLRSKMSPIEDQGQLGSCVAHGTCAALEYLELQDIQKSVIAPVVFGKHFQNLARLYLYYNARAIDGSTDRDAGTQIRSAIKALRDKGICREVLWPYDTSKVFYTPSLEAYGEGSKHKVVTGYRVNNTSLIELKQSLASGYPVIFGVTVYSSFMSPQVAKTGVVPNPSMSDRLEGGHCMALVGYDDSHNAFIVRNSWGTSWGMQGYCLMNYGYVINPQLGSDYWTIRKESVSLHRQDFVCP